MTEEPSQPATTPSDRAIKLAIAIGIVLLASAAWITRSSIGVRGQSVVGLVCFLGIAALASRNIRAVNWRTVATGLLLQLVLALLILRVPFVYRGFEFLGGVVQSFLQFTNKGAAFVFGALADPALAEKAFGQYQGFIFAAQALPTIIFVSSVFTVLYHLRLLQLVVWIFARVMLFVFGSKGVSGAETLAATANVFMGQTEAPLIIKPYVKSMTKSELLALMIGGMATVSGGIMAVFISMGADPVAILATSVMAAPCGLYLSKLLLPEQEEPQTRGEIRMADERPHANVVDAAAGGASDGMMLVLNIIAMLIAFIAGIELINFLLGYAGGLVNGLLGRIHGGLSIGTLSLESIFGRIFSPVAFLMGVSPDDASRVAELLGKKLVLNEFVAVSDLTQAHAVIQEGVFTGVQGIQERSYRLAIYALTGFANISSIGIQLGGIGAMAPNRRSDLAQLGMTALLGGFLATVLNASLAGILM